MEAIINQSKPERIKTDQDRIREFNSIPNYGDGSEYEPEPQRYPVYLQVTDEQYKLLEEALGLLIKQSSGYRQRAINNPSDTIKSTLTIERQQKRIDQLEDIQSRLSENAW